MTDHDRSQIIKDLARYFNWRMLAGFIGSTVVTIAGVVWTAATLYYNNMADIKEIDEKHARKNEVQDQKIDNNSRRLDRAEAYIYSK